VSDEKKHVGNMSLLGGRSCLDFVNTLDWRGTEHPNEYLNTFQDLIIWSQHVGTISDQEAEQLSQKAQTLSLEGTRVLQDSVILREAIYRIFSSIAQGKSAPNKDLAVFNQYLSRTMRRAQIIQKKSGFVWDTNKDQEKLDWILNPVIRSATDLLVSDELKRVKRCGDPACGWLFLDISRNCSRRWCDMSDCGNRAKASRFYKKRKKSNVSLSSSKVSSVSPRPKPG
jgi:predicted RNA-binding Zn ribbon-like protein